MTTRPPIWIAWALFGIACAPGVPEELAEVAPIFERRCAALACHGVPEDPVGLDLHPEQFLTLRVRADGSLANHPDNLISIKAKVSSQGPEFSSLLRKTLPIAQGGLLHFQARVFGSREDPDWQALDAWVRTVSNGQEHADEPPLDALETRFAETVYPLLIQLGCATASCHGELNFGGAVLAVPPSLERFDLARSQLRKSYHEMRSNLGLAGSIAQSRLLRKILPLEFGGMPHKGGNDVFFASELEARRDPRESARARAISTWAELERAVALAKVGAVPAPPVDRPPVVFVGGPIAPGGPFELGRFVPGTDLYMLDGPWTGSAENLTAAHHAGPVDIRDPAVSHDGRLLAFAMRRSPEDAHNIYLLRIDGTELRQLTFNAADREGRLVTANRSPVFGPADATHIERGGDAERLYFVSTRSREWSDRSDIPNSELFAIDLDGENLERLTYTPVAEVTPSFLATGEFAGTMVYTIQRAASEALRGALFRFPVDHNGAYHLQPEAHPHFGTVGPAAIYYGLRELVDGRAALILLDEGNVWRAGALAILDRQLAIELPDGAETRASVPGFRHALTSLTPYVPWRGRSTDGAWRDPAPLPDGSLLAVRIEGSLDLDDASTTPNGALARVSLREDRASLRPTIEAIEVIRTDISVSQPVVIAPRPFEDDPHPRAWSSDDTPGTLTHSGVQVLETLLHRLQPVGARFLRTELTTLRLLAPVEDLWPERVEPALTRDGHPRATRLSLLGTTPLFALTELPIAEDGSLVVATPARQSFRLSTLGPEGFALGAPHHHWSAPKAGENFPVGIAPLAYPVRCAGCHGAMSGVPGDALHPPADVITQASVTAARFEGHDRRRPKTPPVVTGADAIYVDFRRDLLPLIETKCASCHAGAEPAGGLSLSSAPTSAYVDAYESLLTPSKEREGLLEYVDTPGHRAARSYLMERLLGRELEADRSVDGRCPPPGAEPLTEAELETFARWIELGAAYVGLPGGWP